MKQVHAIFLLSLIGLLLGCNKLNPKQGLPLTASRSEAPISEHKKPRAIVFIHGIHGDSHGTWTSNSTQAYWPDLLRHDDSITDADIETRSYPTPFLGNHNDVLDIGKALAKELKPIFDNHEQVVFICHSLGGLIVEQILIDHPDYAQKVPFIAFYATPHSGAFIASFASVFVDDPLLKSMSNSGDEAYLTSLEQGWEERHYRGKVLRYCAYEGRPMSVVDLKSLLSARRVNSTDPRVLQLIPTLVVVNILSATYGCEPGAISPENRIDANHIEISKPADRGDLRYTFFTRRYKMLPSLTANNQALPSAVQPPSPEPTFFESTQCAYYGEANQGQPAFNQDEICIVPNPESLDATYHQLPTTFASHGGDAASEVTPDKVPPGISLISDGTVAWSLSRLSFDPKSGALSLHLYCGPEPPPGRGCNVKTKIIAHYRVHVH